MNNVVNQKCYIEDQEWIEGFANILKVNLFEHSYHTDYASLNYNSIEAELIWVKQ